MKYKNKKIELDGRVFDSQKEATRFAELKLLQRAGKITCLICQKPFVLIPNRYYGDEYVRAIKYIADFYYYDKERGEYIAEDIKGFPTDAYKIKKKIFLEKYVLTGTLTFFENGKKQIFYKKVKKSLDF